jgi:hypothetical protein
MKDVAKAFQIIKEKQACFVSRGDHSGTSSAELNLWKAADADIEKDRGPWYKSIVQGMGATLNFAIASNCYVLSDRGTWMHFKNKGDLQILVDGDRRMFNQYAVMLVNPAKHPDVKKELGQQFIDWLISPDGQKTIANYKIEGEQSFYVTNTSYFLFGKHDGLLRALSRIGFAIPVSARWGMNISGRQILKIAAIIYIAQAVIAPQAPSRGAARGRRTRLGRRRPFRRRHRPPQDDCHTGGRNSRTAA